MKYYVIKTIEDDLLNPSDGYTPEGYLEDYEAHDLRQQLICTGDRELVEFESRSHFLQEMETVDSFESFLEDKFLLHS